MSDLVRFGVSLERGLLSDFDKYINEKGYQNRSEAIRDLIREKLVEKEWEASDEGYNEGRMAVLTIVYDHHQADLTKNLTDIQHKSHGVVYSTLHIHIDHDNCLEILVLKGSVESIKQLGDKIISTRGVRHGKMIFTTTGKGLK
ncbi:MAG: nickel-responsive transcriptional regulator NikR [Deltaproteobacteria bacterium]|uniref:Putative nickel-responsive regulator n=1 Tax=Candidatus Zymogenus saltonus TaxID=2844893 RepID=A0A9D8KF22_9DELT|nr:nickel-responsive transcriptional regulator NikR [Candidatus Zymogenus saltonus]